jgi:DNA-directed RNA polymerase subunit K/omega
MPPKKRKYDRETMDEDNDEDDNCSVMDENNDDDNDMNGDENKNENDDDDDEDNDDENNEDKDDDDNEDDGNENDANNDSDDDEDDEDEDNDKNDDDDDEEDMEGGGEGGASDYNLNEWDEPNADSEDYDDRNKHKKIGQHIDRNELLKYHPECVVQNFEEIRALSDIQLKNAHITIPLLTKYEKARVIGMRTLQLNNGADPLVEIPDTLLDNVIIAEKELMAKKLPFIICRPLPNGRKEYWKLEDLEIL